MGFYSMFLKFLLVILFLKYLRSYLFNFFEFTTYFGNVQDQGGIDFSEHQYFPSGCSKINKYIIIPLSFGNFLVFLIFIFKKMLHQIFTIKKLALYIII